MSKLKYHTAMSYRFKMILKIVMLLVLSIDGASLSFAQSTKKNGERPASLAIGEMPSIGQKKGNETTTIINDWDDAFANEVIAPLYASLKSPTDKAAVQDFLLEYSGSAIATIEQEKHLGRGFENASESPELWDERGCSFQQTVVLKPKALLVSGSVRNGIAAAITFRYQFGINKADLGTAAIDDIRHAFKHQSNATSQLPALPALINAKTLKLQIAKGYVKDNAIVFEPYSQDMKFSFVAPEGTKPDAIKTQLAKLYTLCGDLDNR